MEPASWYELGVAVACLLLVALTSATEVALVQISRHHSRLWVEQNRPTASTIRLLDRPRAYASALTVLRTLGGTAFVLLCADLILRHQVPGRLLTAFLLTAVLLLLVGHLLPRSLIHQRISTAGGTLAGFAWLATVLARPLVALADTANRIARVFTRRTSTSRAVAVAPDETYDGEYGALLDDVEIEPEEREMIDNILELEERTARDIMVPRLDIIAVPEEMPLAAVVEVIERAGHSRVPVYRETIDNIVGMIYAKDLLQFVPREALSIPISHLVRPLDIVVPESKRVDDLLREMRTRKLHMALVADEYGGTAGVVTIEDIIEEIVGEIHDEHDVATAPLIEEVSDHELLVDARASAEEVSDLLGLHWVEEEHNTLGGLVQRELGRLPEEGELLDFGGVRITVLSVEGHRLKRLRVEKLAGANGDGDSQIASGDLRGERMA